MRSDYGPSYLWGDTQKLDRLLSADMLILTNWAINTLLESFYIQNCTIRYHKLKQQYLYVKS
jgi:hypothetical protein